MLKAYMVYSCDYGPQEGALLVFAHTVREARKVGYENGGSDITDRYIDFGACLLRGCDWLFSEADQEKLKKDEAHLIWNMKSCSECEQWGASPIGDDGLCEECRGSAAEQLLAPSENGLTYRSHKCVFVPSTVPGIVGIVERCVICDRSPNEKTHSTANGYKRVDTNPFVPTKEPVSAL